VVVGVAVLVVLELLVREITVVTAMTHSVLVVVVVPVP
jgi:hypothetical protein